MSTPRKFFFFAIACFLGGAAGAAELVSKPEAEAMVKKAVVFIKAPPTFMLEARAGR